MWFTWTFCAKNSVLTRESTFDPHQTWLFSITSQRLKISSQETIFFFDLVWKEIMQITDKAASYRSLITSVKVQFLISNFFLFFSWDFAHLTDFFLSFLSLSRDTFSCELEIFTTQVRRVNFFLLFLQPITSTSQSKLKCLFRERWESRTINVPERFSSSQDVLASQIIIYCVNKTRFMLYIFFCIRTSMFLSLRYQTVTKNSEIPGRLKVA